MIVEEPQERLQSMEEVIAAIDTAVSAARQQVLPAAFARNLGAGSGNYEQEHRLSSCSEIRVETAYQVVTRICRWSPVWLPRTRRLTIDLRLHPGTKDAHYAVELFDNGSKRFDSGRLPEGRSEHEVEPGWVAVGRRYASAPIAVGGRRTISNLVVHAAIGEDPNS